MSAGPPSHAGDTWGSTALTCWGHSGQHAGLTPLTLRMLSSHACVRSRWGNRKRRRESKTGLGGDRARAVRGLRTRASPSAPGRACAAVKMPRALAERPADVKSWVRGAGRETGNAVPMDGRIQSQGHAGAVTGSVCPRGLVGEGMNTGKGKCAFWPPLRTTRKRCPAASQA